MLAPLTPGFCSTLLASPRDAHTSSIAILAQAILAQAKLSHRVHHASGESCSHGEPIGKPIRGSHMGSDIHVSAQWRCGLCQLRDGSRLVSPHRRLAASTFLVTSHSRGPAPLVKPYQPQALARLFWSRGVGRISIDTVPACSSHQQQQQGQTCQV